VADGRRVASRGDERQRAGVQHRGHDMGVVSGWQYRSQTPPAVMIMSLLPADGSAEPASRGAAASLEDRMGCLSCAARGQRRPERGHHPSGFQQVSSPADQ